ncbi:hypothetical protein B0J12DRAFT_211544 [Macrophomina phaseolina]|uniref:Uncharacterized protein n=1 Tax=Macrophomina phaseolina TaxID=35725 RepID=A0ABQ8G1W4_9PEZI|nr:hypothetical protein B0J12DRAFT_211544 [Macrophomina phaseolina]
MVVLPIKKFKGFWDDYGPLIAKIVDERHEFTGKAILRVAKYILMISVLSNLVDLHFASSQYELKTEILKEIKVFYWYDPDITTAEEEAETGVKEPCTDLYQRQHDQVTEGVLIEGDTSSSNPLEQGQRRGTPFPGYKTGDSDKENRSGPVRSKKRRWEALGSSHNGERKKRQNGASLECPIDLTGD